MPRCKLMKSTIDALATPTTDVIWWDAEIKGFGLKVPPRRAEGVLGSVPTCWRH
jgi:hypothetical protein